MGRNNQQRRRLKSKRRRAARRTPDASGAAFARSQSAGAGEPFPAGASFGASEGFQGGGTGFAAAAATEHRSPEQHARDLILVAVGQRDSEALLPLLHFTRERAGRAAVQRAFCSLVRAQLEWAWRHGWQPADLHRMAVRNTSGLASELLRDAMAEDLARYAAPTVDPRWHDQLHELECVVWWPAATTYLAARTTTARQGWQEVLPAALSVLELFGPLPPLESLGPRPGEATAADRAAAERAGQADQRILSKVRALLAKAESTPYEAEADTFTAGAQAMMARHSIDTAMLEAADAQHTGPLAIRIGVDRPYEAPKAMLLHAVADANRCRTVWTKQLGFATVVGFTADLRAVETLFTSLLVQATRAVAREGSRRTSWGQSRTRSFRQSFLTAFAARIGERLGEVTAAEVQAADQAGSRSDAHVGGATGPRQDLLPVLAARTGAVEEAVETLFPYLVHRSVASVHDAEGWHSGRAAADQASLEPHTPLTAG